MSLLIVCWHPGFFMKIEFADIQLVNRKIGAFMKYTIKENQLDYETYYNLRESVGWNNWSKVQAQKALKKSYYNCDL